MALTKTILNGHTVEYDNTEFEILTSYCSKEKYLHYIGNGGNVHNPKGNTSCYRMFDSFNDTSLDLSNFDTHNITNMSFMFFYCQNLKSLNLSNFNTKNVVDMSGMFSYCESLKKINLSNFITQNVNDMSYMFNKCYNLITLNLSNFNTYSVNSMKSMFSNCVNLKKLDISNFDLTKEERINSMFTFCKKLEKIIIDSNLFQYISDNKNSFLRDCENVSIISTTQINKTIKDLFY